MSPRGALAILQSCVQGTNLCKKYHAGHMRAHDQPDTCLELLGAPISSSTRSPSSRPRASSTDGHHHRRRSCHDRPRHRRADVILNRCRCCCLHHCRSRCRSELVIAHVRASSVCESSSPTHWHNYRYRGCLVEVRMGFADQVAGGWVGCLHEQWNGQQQVRSKKCTT